MNITINLNGNDFSQINSKQNREEKKQYLLNECKNLISTSPEHTEALLEKSQKYRTVFKNLPFLLKAPAAIALFATAFIGKTNESDVENIDKASHGTNNGCNAFFGGGGSAGESMVDLIPFLEIFGSLSGVLGRVKLDHKISKEDRNSTIANALLLTIGTPLLIIVFDNLDKMIPTGKNYTNLLKGLLLVTKSFTFTALSVAFGILALIAYSLVFSKFLKNHIDKGEAAAKTKANEWLDKYKVKFNDLKNADTSAQKIYIEKGEKIAEKMGEKNFSKADFAIRMAIGSTIALTAMILVTLVKGYVIPAMTIAGFNPMLISIVSAIFATLTMFLGVSCLMLRLVKPVIEAWMEKKCFEKTEIIIKGQKVKYERATAMVWLPVIGFGIAGVALFAAATIMNKFVFDKWHIVLSQGLLSQIIVSFAILCNILFFMFIYKALPLAVDINKVVNGTEIEKEQYIKSRKTIGGVIIGASVSVIAGATALFIVAELKNLQNILNIIHNPITIIAFMLSTILSMFIGVALYGKTKFLEDHFSDKAVTKEKDRIVDVVLDELKTLEKEEGSLNTNNQSVDEKKIGIISHIKFTLNGASDAIMNRDIIRVTA